MACVLGYRVGLRRTLGTVVRTFRYAKSNSFKSARSVVSLASARSFLVTSVTGRSTSSLLGARYCISATTTSRGYTTDSEAGKIYRSLELSPDGKKLCVSWADGEESTYHAVWLRHNCRCPQCWDDKYAAPLVFFDSLRNVGIKSADLSDGNLNVRWGYSDGTEEHTGYFPLHFLKKHSYSANALQKRRSDRPVVAEHLPTVAYPDMMSDEKHLWMWMKNLNLYGVCLVTDMPAVEDEVLKLTNSVGSTHATMFGETFRVVVENNPDDVAYTGNALPYHSDLSGWCEYPPGLQILHCIIFEGNVEGGETLVLDAFPVLEELREKHPKQFEILATVPASFQRQTVLRDRGKVSMERQKPHIILDGRGEITTLYLHPNSEAPLSIEEDKVESYYDAYCLLQEMMNTSKYQHKVRLQPGQALTFNNRRCVHGRTAIKLNGGKRYLQGTYINGDDLKGAMRLLAEKYEPDFVLRRTFNLDPL